MEALIHENYPFIVEDFYSGIISPVVKAGMSRSYKWCYMTEMKIVDADYYNYLQEIVTCSDTLSVKCKHYNYLSEDDGQFQ